MQKHHAAPDSNPDSRRRGSPSFLQRLGNFDLFSNLLFNRERVYQGLKRLSPVRTSASKEDVNRGYGIESEDRVVPSIEDDNEEEEMPITEVSMISYLKSTDMAVSKLRGRPPKKTSAKATSKGRMGVAATKKRSPPARTRTERASKIQKTVPKANSGKRVNAGASITDVYVISDSEDEDTDLQRQIATNSLTPPRQTLKIDSPGREDDLKPMPLPTPTPTPTHSNNLENELVRVKVAHAREVECLRLQLSASQAEVEEVKADAQRQALDLQRQQSISSDKQMADREEELETERRRTSDLTWECDHLRKEMEAARSCLRGEVDLIQQRDDYERLYNEEKETSADVVRGLEEKNQELTRKAEAMALEIQQTANQIEEKDREATRKAEEAATESSHQTKQIEDLQREVSDLMSENAALRISANEPPSPAVDERASPAHSMSSSQLTLASDADLKLANVRKTYIKVKKRYDNLHSVASNISTATRSWDYGSFGEFGAYLRQLKTALDENGAEEQGAVLASQAARTD